MASSVLQVRVDNGLKKKADDIFHNLGFDMSSAIRLFLNRVVLEQGLPFSMKVSSSGENAFDPVEYVNSYIKEE